MEKPPNYGIDSTDAGTSQERYFMVLAGLLHKNLLVQTEIRDALVALNKKSEPQPEAPAKTRVVQEPYLSEAQRQGKKGAR